MTHTQPLNIALLSLLFVLIGLAIIYGARQRWRWLVDPPEWLYLVYSQSFLKVLFGRKFVLFFTYFMGSLFVLASILVGGMSGYIQFTGGPDGAVTANSVKIEPHSATQAHFETLLRTIGNYLNTLIFSLLFLIGIRLKWFLKGEPPRWVISIFENNRVVRLLYLVLSIAALYSAVMVTPYIRELGQRLGYW